jgi:hypothetical protein
MNQDPAIDNTNVLMEGVQAAETAATSTSTSSYSLPMLMFALIGLGFAGSHVWANRAGWQEVITGKAATSACSFRQSGCCSSKSSEGGCCSSQQQVLASTEGGGCCKNKTAAVLAALEGSEGCPASGCPMANKDKVLAQQEGACCDKMKNALASALLEAHDKHSVTAESTSPATNEVAVNVASEPEYKRIPAPPMPE